MLGIVVTVKGPRNFRKLKTEYLHNHSLTKKNYRQRKILTFFDLNWRP